MCLFVPAGAGQPELVMCCTMYVTTLIGCEVDVSSQIRLLIRYNALAVDLWKQS